MSTGACLPAGNARLTPPFLPRLVAGSAAVALATAAFPFLPAGGAALLCLVLGAAIALPGAAAAAVRRGHDLGRFAETGLVRRALRGGGLRVLCHGALGTALAALLLVRLSAGGPGVWLATGAALPAVLVAVPAAGLAAEQAALRLEEYLHREAFRAEIVAALEARRAAMLAALE